MENIKVLQLCSYYTSSKVHQSLFSNLDKQIQQQVYVPVRIKNKIGSNTFQLQNGTLTYDKIWSLYHRVLYRNKIKKAFNKLKNQHEKFNIIHAHTWFSDGGTAYLLNSKHNIPFIVAVRDTDLNLFYKRLPFKKKIGHKILTNASKIIFISPAYKKELLSILPTNLVEIVSKKAVIIPNGIDDYWFMNQFNNRKVLKTDIFKLLFVGEITKRKNIERLIEAYLQFKKNVQNCGLTIIGFRNKGKYEKKIKDKYGKIENLRLLDEITDKKELLTHYREANLFIMPSLTETFGLVYIEALSQGLPIIYSKGHGVDGYFDQINNGISVYPKSQSEIFEAIVKIYEGYNEYIVDDLSYLDQFKWKNIADEYVKLYSDISNQ